MKGLSTKPGYSSLRKGRTSIPGQVYFLTWRTFGRSRVLEDFGASRQMIQCLKYSDLEDWTSTLAFVIMPDHIHWCFELGFRKSLEEVAFSIKSYSSKCLIASGFEKAPVWQQGFHDRAVRATEDIVAVSRYIVANPLRAGLVDEIGDYPHWDAVWLDS